VMYKRRLHLHETQFPKFLIDQARVESRTCFSYPPL
jgi:hypothetical protein